MKKIFALSFVSAKLAYLACFGVMGMMGAVSAASAAVMASPCHLMVEEEKQMESNCSACEDSEMLWSQDFIAPRVEMTLQDVQTDQVFLFGSETTIQTKETVLRETVPDPPEIGFYASTLRTQTGIVLLN